MSQSNEPEPVDAEFEPAPIEEPSEKPRRGGFLGGFLVFLFASVTGGVLGFAGAYWLDGQGETADPAETPATLLVPLEARLSALEDGTAMAETEREMARLRDRIERLESAPPVLIGDTDPDALADIQARLTALESVGPTTTTGLDPAPLEARLATIETMATRAETLANQALDASTIPADSTAETEIVQSLTERILALETAASQPVQPVDLSALETRLAAAEVNASTALDQANAASQAATGTGSAESARFLAARTLGLMALAEIAETARPFEAERAALARIWRSRPELITLQPLARSGIPDRASLTATFPREAIEAAAGPSERLFGMIEIRRVAPTDGDDGPRTLAGFASARLERGDLEGAVAATERLEGEPLAAAQAWLISAQARMTVDEALTALRAALIDEAVAEGADPR